MDKGVWIDGNLSEDELAKLQELIRKAVMRARNGTLPFKYKDEKITFEAFSRLGTVAVFYGWNFPPKEFWVKENRGLEECTKCLPNGFQGEPAREVWCVKLGYNFQKCPYGVKTEKGNAPWNTIIG